MRRGPSMGREPEGMRGRGLPGGELWGSAMATCRPLPGASRGEGVRLRSGVTSRRFIGASRGDGFRIRNIAKSRRFNNASRADGIISDARGGCSQRGYTLIEVLVAFAVLALALTLLLGTLSGASRQVHWSAVAGRAALHAESLLAQTGVGETLQPGRRDGDFEDGRYRWVLDVAPYDDPTRAPPTTRDPFSPQLMQLRLQVAWGDGGRGEQIVVDSLRLVAPDREQRALP